MTVTEPRVAGRYRIGPSLGVGGMGRVWLARDELLGRDVAIKQVALPFGLSDSEREELRRRTLREARAAARLSHPNVVRIFDVVHAEEPPWIVMEYVPSRSLLQVVEENGPLPPEQVAGIGLAVLSALDAANRAGVLHRDVKPSNVLIADDGRVVLTDFGSAIIDESEGAITRTGVILGSPQYIAPERASNGTSTASSDLWSLGATLYAAVEGRAPYTRPTAMATLIALATKRPDPMRLAGPLKPVLSGLLHKDPEARMGAAEAELRLHRVADVQTAVRLRHVPPTRRNGRSDAESERGWIAADSVTAAHRVSLEAAIAQLERAGKNDGATPPAASSERAFSGPASVDPTRGDITTPIAVPASTAGTAREAEAAWAATPAPFTTSARALNPVPPQMPTLHRRVQVFRRRTTRWQWAAAAAFAVLLIALSAVAFRQDDADRSSAAPTADGAGVAAGSSGVPVVASPDAPSDPDAPPAGFEWWNDESGFRVAIPVGWINVREGPAAMLFCEPGAPRSLRVHPWDRSDPDLLAALAREEAKAKLVGYQRIRMEVMPAGHAAEWEYTFDGPAGKLRGLERAFVMLGHGWMLQWRLPVGGWPLSLPGFDVITGSFHPPRRPPVAFS